MDSSKVMMLEDFLTLSDVKDGITNPSRIEELITLMQKEKDGEVKGADEAARQHSAIARIVAETKNTSCLDHFIKLGGLCYINGWLHDAGTSADDSLEESITLQCWALEKLCINNEMLVSSGVLDTVKNLCDHNSTIIKEKARELLDNWTDVGLTVSKDVEKADAVVDNEEDRALTNADENGSLLKAIDVGPEQAEASPKFMEAAKDEEPVLNGSDCLQLVEADQIKAEGTCSQMTTPVSLDQKNVYEEAISTIIDTGVSISKIVTSGEGIANVNNLNSSDTRDNIGDDEPGALENTNSGEVIVKINSTSADLKIDEFTQSSNPQESEGCSSGADILMAEAHQTVTEPGTQTSIGCKESLVPMILNSVDDTKDATSENCTEMDDIGHQRSLVRGSPERASPTLDASPAHAASDVVVGLNSRSDEDYSKVSAIQNLARDTKSSNMAETRSDVDRDYGLMDPLEVARQVAKAVEMDMVNDGSSENISDASRQPGSSDSSSDTDSQSRNISGESSKLESSTQPSTEKKSESSSSEKIQSEPKECMQGVDQPQSLAQEVQVNSNENTCEFDLNQEVPCENADFSVNYDRNTGEGNGTLNIQNLSSVCSPVESGSRSHVDDPELARSHGLRGPDGNRAFHQLSPHRVAYPHAALPFGPSSISEKQRTFGFDLNLDKEGNDSNVAAAPTESQKFDFDLNMMSDVEDTPSSSSWRPDNKIFSHLNGHPSSSSASSLFPMQPTTNIDLNEGQAMHSISSGPHPLHVGSSSNPKVDVPPFFGTLSSPNVGVQQDGKSVISIMGARVELDRNESSHGAPLSNGKSENHSMEANVGTMGSYLGIGSMGIYGHPSHFAYNNTNAGAGPAMSLVSPMFRPGNTMSYMVDPRVGPLPQMVNSPPVLPQMYAAQPPFFVNMAGPSLGLNGVLPARPNFDLNLGFMNQGGNRQDVASRQLFDNNQGRFIAEHLNPPESQPSSSFGKRKESETGWETYPYNMKHRYPPGNR